jgi:hypothetical protein
MGGDAGGMEREAKRRGVETSVISISGRSAGSRPARPCSFESVGSIKIHHSVIG